LIAEARDSTSRRKDSSPVALAKAFYLAISVSLAVVADLEKGEGVDGMQEISFWGLPIPLGLIVRPPK
jgi:hypothetical protein